MNNKFEEGQSVLYNNRIFTVMDAWQVNGNWLYDIDRSDQIEFSVPEAQLSDLPADQQLRQSGTPMLPGMEGE